MSEKLNVSGAEKAVILLAHKDDEALFKGLIDCLCRRWR